MTNFVLYYQATGPTSLDPYPMVLFVGTKEKCESARLKLLEDPQFSSMMARAAHGVLQIVAAAHAPRAVVNRAHAYQSSVGELGGVRPI
ncbi:MAG: hypothetical protein DVB28_000701 [Verrucomicrobia bacterium]|nr:MAG: hypothetical protein DVB28_000701 [Verrucomicrobiota bacterium]